MHHCSPGYQCCSALTSVMLFCSWVCAPLIWRDCKNKNTGMGKEPKLTCFMFYDKVTSLTVCLHYQATHGRKSCVCKGLNVSVRYSNMHRLVCFQQPVHLLKTQTQSASDPQIIAFKSRTCEVKFWPLQPWWVSQILNSQGQTCFLRSPWPVTTTVYSVYPWVHVNISMKF